MNLKLDVVRFANEDVIATSCDKHPNTKHIKTVYINDTIYQQYVDVDAYEAGETTGYSSDRNRDEFDPALTAASEVGKWYYFDGSHYVECDGDHSDYQRIIH